MLAGAGGDDGGRVPAIGFGRRAGLGSEDEQRADDMTNHLWQSTVFAVFAAMLAWALRGNRASVRYGVWLAASVKFLVPFAGLMVWGSHVSWAPKARAAAPAVVSVAVGEMARPFGDVDVVRMEKARRQVDWVPLAGLGIWVVGFVGVGVKRWTDWRRVRAAVRGSSVLQIRAGVEVRSAAGLLEPGVVGIFKQVLLLPEGILARLSPEQMTNLRAALLREFETNSQDNGYLLEEIARRYENGDAAPWAGVVTVPERIAALTATAIQQAARTYLDTDNYVKVTLIPESK